ncbi:hypothetical protein LINPERPRIM_LOCUS5279 [Linum perenne]
MELTHHTSRAIKKGEFAEFLDPDVPDWPSVSDEYNPKVLQRLCLAKLAIRPDLNDVLLPELCRLRELAKERMASLYFAGGDGWQEAEISATSWN